MSFAVLGSGESAFVFEASADKVRTWQEARRTGAARWVAHEVYQGRPVKEFIGPADAQITLERIRLDYERGIIPRDELRKLREQRDTGVVLQFTIGGELVGDFFIREIAEAWMRFSRTGVLLLAVIDLTLELYT